MSDFRVEALTKSVGDKTVFSDLSFIIHDDDKIGLIGVNGTGKTTLLNVISGHSGFDGDKNPFLHPHDYKITYLTQEPDFKEDDTILDAILDETLPQMAIIKGYEKALERLTEDPMNEDLQGQLSKREEEVSSNNAWSIEQEVKTVLSKLDITDTSKKISSLSGGQKRRVQLAQALVNPSDLLLLDEPTNHLDVETIAWLQNYLTSLKRAVLFITHDRYFLDNVANRIFELDQGGVIEYQGNYQDYLTQRAEREEAEASQQHKKRQLFKQELSWIRKSPQARATKQQARIDRFESLKDSMTSDNSENLEINLATSRLGKKVVKLEDANFSYPDKKIFSDFDLLLQADSRIGIIGDNGSGKSTLLNIINGDLELDSGLLDIGETVKIGYFSQNIRGLDESKRVINFLEEVAAASTNKTGEMTSVVNLLEQFLFPRSTHGTLISKLSGGEKKRLYLLKILLEQPNVLLLDEPTNDLDIATLTVLEDFLASFPGAVITVSHDRYFLDKVASQLLIFDSGTINKYHGNYSTYLLSKVDKPLEKIEEAPLEKTAKVKEKKERLSYFEQKEWATIEDEIMTLEERISEIETEMNENGSDFGKLSILQKELDEANDTLLEKYDRYEYLSGKA
ncbi:ABC-F family ATP-binding cassette domain-containing protein [Streptococcaceae bacterium ESL0729]|nr:ABC-F family ATP-binding cassette domain-containing protein [Streptococcaceae bacterium ESL0729]